MWSGSTIICLSIMRSHQVVAERGQPARVAVRRRADRRAPRRPGRSAPSTSPISDVARERRAPSYCVVVVDVVLRPWQVCMSQNVPVSMMLPVLTTTPVVPPSPRDAGERVVELVDQLHVADAERRRPRPGAGRLSARSQLGCRCQPRQSKRLGDLDPEDDRELARVDDAPRLERVGDDPEQALAGAAALRVDVVLQLAHVAGPAGGRCPSRCRSCVLRRVQLAEHAVLDEAGSRTAAGRRATRARASGSSVCSWVSGCAFGQSVEGRPADRVVRVRGVAVERTFSSTRAARRAASWSGQSASAYVMP